MLRDRSTVHLAIQRKITVSEISETVICWFDPEKGRILRGLPYWEAGTGGFGAPILPDIVPSPTPPGKPIALPGGCIAFGP